MAIILGQSEHKLHFVKSDQGHLHVCVPGGGKQLKVNFWTSSENCRVRLCMNCQTVHRLTAVAAALTSVNRDCHELCMYAI